LEPCIAVGGHMNYANTFVISRIQVFNTADTVT